MKSKSSHVPQHTFAIKVSETLKKLGIPEAGRDRFGNPHIAQEWLVKLPKTLKADLYVKKHWRIILRSYPQ